MSDDPAYQALPESIPRVYPMMMGLHKADFLGSEGVHQAVVLKLDGFLEMPGDPPDMNRTGTMAIVLPMPVVEKVLPVLTALAMWQRHSGTEYPGGTLVFVNAIEELERHGFTVPGRGTEPAASGGQGAPPADVRGRDQGDGPVRGGVPGGDGPGVAGGPVAGPPDGEAVAPPPPMPGLNPSIGTSDPATCQHPAQFLMRWTREEDGAPMAMCGSCRTVF